MKRLLFAFVLFFVSLSVFAKTEKYIYCKVSVSGRKVVVDCGQFLKFLPCKEIKYTNSILDLDNIGILFSKDKYKDLFSSKRSEMDIFNFTVNYMADFDWEYVETRTSMSTNKNMTFNSSSDCWIFRKKVSDFKEEERNEILDFLNQ